MRNLRLLFFTALLLSCATMWALGTSSSWYARATGGVEVWDFAGDGANFGLEVGKGFKGLQVGLAMSYTIGKDGGEDRFWHEYKSDGTKVGHVEKTSETRYRALMLRANASYDLLSLAGRELRHHVSPAVGVGVVFASDDVTSYDENLRGTIGHGARDMNDLSVAVGGRYEFDITHDLSLGLYYEHWFNYNDNVAGITFVKRF